MKKKTCMWKMDLFLIKFNSCKILSTLQLCFSENHKLTKLFIWQKGKTEPFIWRSFTYVSNCMEKDKFLFAPQFHNRVKNLVDTLEVNFTRRYIIQIINHWLKVNTGSHIYLYAVNTLNNWRLRFSKWQIWLVANCCSQRTGSNTNLTQLSFVLDMCNGDIDHEYILIPFFCSVPLDHTSSAFLS